MVGVRRNGEIAHSKNKKNNKRASPNLKVITPDSRPFHVGEVVPEVARIKYAEACLVLRHVRDASLANLFMESKQYKLKQEDRARGGARILL